MAHHVPTWDNPCAPWTKLFSHSQLWRMKGSMDIADLMQEGWLVYNKCSDRYGHGKITPGNFMALYKTSVTNRFHSLAGKTQTPKHYIHERFGFTNERFPDLDTTPSSAVQNWTSLVDFYLDLYGSPKLLKLYRGTMAHRRPRNRLQLGFRRELTSEFLCRLADIPHTKNIREELESLCTL